MTKEIDYYFESIGENFDKWMSNYDVHRRVLLIRKYIGSRGKGKSCIEIGCGTGKISRAVVDLVGELTVSDISEKLASKVGKEMGVSWTCQDACSLELPDNSYDIVISSECIEHVPNPQKALKEMARILKPGGFLVVTTPNKLWYPVLWLSMATKIRKFAGREIWLFPSTAEKILASQGINNIALDGCHLFPVQIPGAKKILPLFDKAGKWLYPIMINFCITGEKLN